VVPFDGPLELVLRFRMPRPGTRKADTWCATTPDFDKLARAVCDALTDAEMIVDDARIAACVIEKRYVAPPDIVGVTITVGQLW
jgi:Holliday junction resolvase RusA-like endonuclease